MPRRGALCTENMPPLKTFADVRQCPVPLISRAAEPHIDRAVRSGHLVRVMRGVYAPEALWRELKPWDRYLTRVHAAARCYPDAVFVRESAAALRGLPVFGEPPHVHAVALGSSATHAVGAIRLHAAERPPQFENLDGMLVATGLEIAVDAARLRHPAVARAVADAALRADPRLTTGHMRALSETHPSSRGRRRARDVFDRASAVPESPLESVSATVIEALGFPLPEMQLWVRGPEPGEDDRVDFAWSREGRLIGGEADGDIKYSGTLGDARAALRERHARDARLMRRGVHTVHHWAWADVAEPSRLRAILLSAGVQILRQPNLPLLGSLGGALRGLH
ncbi:hypothetical protein HMPREF1529_02005 [Microbacterium sp. oral taxon 186 str. F0373]|jgi:hypothetical protein|nr:hypothetical protein HMPREF1529_02005 [Microbacterium sp. oral taxon 186 str. F0373]